MAERTVRVRLEAAVAGYQAAVAQAAASTRAFGRDVSQMSAQHKREMQTVGLALTVMGAAGVAAFGASAKAAIDWESAFAGVRKTVEGTPQQLDAIGAGLRAMSKELPTSANDLAGIAAAAGQLGIETPNVLGFTRVIADLGETTNLAGEQGATQLARFANITQMSQGDFDRLGSTIVALGNNFATTEAEITTLGLRLAGAGAQIGLTESEILSMAAALSSVGVEAEAGGSAFSRVMVEVQKSVLSGSEELAVFAHTAGMSAGQFAAAWREDAASALNAFIVGLGGVIDSGGNADVILEELGLDGLRVADSLKRAAGAGDLFDRTLQVGNQAWVDNVALTQEAALRYETVEARLQMAKNALTDAAVAVGQDFTPAIGGAADMVAGLATGIAGLPGPLRVGATVVTGLGSAAALAVGGFLLLAPRIVETRKALQALQATAAGGKIVSALGGMASMLAGPLGIALAVGTVAVGQYAAQQAEARRRVEEMTATLDEQTGAVTENTRAHVANRLAQEGARDAARDLGVSFQTVVDAAMGSASAQRILALRAQEVHDATSAEIESLENVGRSMQGAAHDGGVLSEQTADHARALGIVTRAIDGERETLEKSTSAKREDLVELAESEGRYLDFAHALESGVDPALARYVEQTLAAENATGDHADAQDDLAGEVDETVAAIDQFEDALNRLIGVNITAEEAAIRWEDALDDLAETFGENGDTLDISTRKGRDNRRSFLDAAEAALAHGRAIAEQTGSAEAGQGAIEGMISRLRREAIEAGLSEEAIDELMERLGLTPGEVEKAMQQAARAADQGAAFEESGRRSGEGLVRGMDSTLAMARRKAAELGQVVAEATARALNIRSPSRVFYELGEDTVAGYVLALEDGAHDVEAAARGLIDQALSGVDAIMGGFGALSGRESAQGRVDRLTAELAALEARQGALPGEIHVARGVVSRAQRDARQVTPAEEAAILRARDRLARAEQDLAEARLAGTATADQLRLLELDVTLAQEALTRAEQDAVGPTRELEEAHRALADLLHEQETVTAELEDARAALTEAQLKAIDAEAALLEAGQDLIDQGPEGEQLFRDLATAAGLTQDEIDDLIASYRELARVSTGQLSGTAGQVSSSRDTLLRSALDALGISYGGRVDQADIRAGLRRIGHDPGGRIDPEDEAVLIRTATFDSGGVLSPGATMAFNKTGRDEFVLTQQQLAAVAAGTQSPDLTGGDGSATPAHARVQLVAGFSEQQLFAWIRDGVLTLEASER
jgi:TP901 family phage tail tape measure protein